MKQFTIIYDKEQKQYANMLDVITSDSDLEKTEYIEHGCKEYQKNMPLNNEEYILFLGNKSSSMYTENFKDKYSKYGIHIGFRGTKAWIYCEKAKWNKKVYKEFHNDALSLYEKLDLNPIKIQDFVDAGIKDFVSTGTSSAPAGATDIQTILWESVISSAILINPMLLIVYRMQRWIKGLSDESTRIDQQYRFAIILFFSEYLKEYLNITDTDN